MYYLKTFFFLGCCFLLGIGLANGVKHFRGNQADAFATPHVGVGNAPRLRGFALPLNDSTPVSLHNLPLAQLRATAITLGYPPAPSANSAKDLADSVAAAHAQGAQVVLLPSPVYSSLNSNPYPKPLETIAREAQAAHVDALCISWLHAEPDPATLKHEAAAVRQVFTGKLILAATPEILTRMESFDDVDYIATMYPPTLPQRLPHASEEIDINSMRVFWDCVLGSLESRAIKASRPLLLLNMGVSDTIQVRLPLPNAAPNTTPNPEVQQLAYEALLMQTKGRIKIEGLFLPWSPQAAADNPVAINRFPELVKKLNDLWSSATPLPPTTSGPSPDNEPGLEALLPWDKQQ